MGLYHKTTMAQIQCPWHTRDSVSPEPQPKSRGAKGARYL